MRAWAAALCGVLVAIGTPASAAESLIGASSDDHLWFVLSPARPPGPIVVRHHARESGGPYYSRGLELGRAPNAVPEALAAWNNRLWVVFRPRSGMADGELRRQAFTVQVRLNPAFGGWYYDPPDRLGVLPALDGRGELAGLVGTDDGPVALLVAGGPPPLRPPVRDPDERPRLMALWTSQWTAVDLPPGFRGLDTARLAAAGPDGLTLVILEPAAGQRQRTMTWWRDAEGGWTASEIDLDLSGVVSVTRAGAMIAIASHDPAGGEVEVGYLRRNGVLPVASFVAGEPHFTILGMRDGPRYVGVSEAGEPRLATIDPISGAVGEPLAMSSQRLVTQGLWHLPLLVAVTIIAVLFVFLFRPSPERAVPLPEGMVPLRPLARLTAVAVDLAAAGLVAALVLGIDQPAVFLRLPLWTPELDAAIPGFVMVGFTALHSTASELLGGWTLGKLLVGGRVIAPDGSRPTPGAVILRNLVKLVILLVPVLVVVALFNPHWQGLDDQVGRTLVVRRHTPETAPGKDR
jgi:uncharacterized RDD family membrane protein YckC